VAVHCADACVAHANEKSRRDAVENPRNEITQGPVWNKVVLPQHPGNGPDSIGYGWRSSACDSGPHVPAR
jgi:hypothetical protein